MVSRRYFCLKCIAMQYKIEYDTIKPIIEEEISREGAQAYSDEGVSLYDGIRLISRDEAKMKRLMSEVLVAIKMQCNRFVKHADVVTSPTEPLSFLFELDLSKRRSAGKEESLNTVFRSMTANFMLNKYFSSKNMTDLAAKYDSLALADVQTLTRLLYEKLPPVYSQEYE